MCKGKFSIVVTKSASEEFNNQGEKRNDHNLLCQINWGMGRVYCRIMASPHLNQDPEIEQQTGLGDGASIL